MNENTSMLKKCVDLVSRYNNLKFDGHDKLHLSITPVMYSTICPKNAVVSQSVLAQEIVAFFEQYTSQMITASKLKTILESSFDNVLTSDIIHLITNGSEQEDFNRIRDSLHDNHQIIIDNLSTAVEQIVQRVSSNVTPTSNISDIIQTIFTCMKQEGLSRTIAISSTVRPFVYVGVRLIELIHKLGLLEADTHALIQTLTADLKESMLDVRHELDTPSAFNYLQTFSIVPSDANNKSLQEVVRHLLHIDLDGAADVDVVSSLLKQISIDSGVSTGIIIYASPHPDIYFNLQPLLQTTQGRTPSAAEGIDIAKVSKFDIIKLGDAPTATTSHIKMLNVDADTERAYVLWTNNFKSYKWRSEPISSSTIKKILRRKPSQTIEQFNKRLEEEIISSRKFDGYSYNLVRYMSFTRSVTMESFLEILTTRVVDFLLAKLGGINIRTAATLNDELIDELIQIIDEAKDELGVPRDILSAHCRIVYASITMKLASKIKKEMVLLCSSTQEDEHLTRSALLRMVKTVIQSNDNIYSRVIASHYLHLA